MRILTIWFTKGCNSFRPVRPLLRAQVSEWRVSRASDSRWANDETISKHAIWHVKEQSEFNEDPNHSRSLTFHSRCYCRTASHLVVDVQLARAQWTTCKNLTCPAAARLRAEPRSGACQNALCRPIRHNARQSAAGRMADWSRRDRYDDVSGQCSQ